MRRSIVALLLAVTAPAAFTSQAFAQYPGSRPGFGQQPQTWVGLSVGFIDGMTIDDGQTASEWQFGYSTQVRASLEMAVQGDMTVGLAAGFSTAPLVYSSYDGFGECAFSCTGHADITQILGTLRGGGGLGLHGIYELEAGVTEFSNFREDFSNVQLPPNSRWDFSFAFGGGVGYGLAGMGEIFAAEEIGTVLQANNDNNNIQVNPPRIFTTRIGWRYGF